MKKCKREITGISFEPNVFERIEQRRGQQNRSKYLNHVLKKSIWFKGRGEVR